MTNSDPSTTLPEKSAVPTLNPEIISKIVLQGDISSLKPAEKVSYYNDLCRSLGLNPATQPFGYMNLKGKETLYAKKDAGEQLRFLHNVSIDIKSRDILGDIYVVTAKATLPNGRTDESTGAVPIKGLVGEQKANAFMKAETKSKRRVTLSICGLGMIDENEVKDIPMVKEFNQEDVKKLVEEDKKIEATTLLKAKGALVKAASDGGFKPTDITYYLEKVAGLKSTKEMNIEQVHQLTKDINDGSVMAWFAENTLGNGESENDVP